MTNSVLSQECKFALNFEKSIIAVDILADFLKTENI